ncbi:hypothetical protein BDV29DRAFT_173170 [Aspergillus leporis]|uniref:Uncharacterized protein n=1 Tax=Aspergillus leporis TaxID=41062 RepID=A0A5N5X1N8_9EURO|nr:hypothetical protein BDV29DRAFT_173170 [Aspergillus leporis]
MASLITGTKRPSALRRMRRIISTEPYAATIMICGYFSAALFAMLHWNGRFTFQGYCGIFGRGFLASP